MDTDLILLEKFAGTHSLEAAQTIDGFTEEEIAAIIDEFPADLLVDVITLMNSYKVAKCLELVKTSKAIALVEKMDVHASELILRQCNEDLRNEMLTEISPKISSVLRQKLKHEAFTIGSLMNPLFLSLKKEQPIKEAGAKIKHAKKSSTIFPVVNAEGKLEGIVKIQDLFLADGKSLIESIMKTEIPKFSANMSIKSVVNHPGWYEYQSIPVIDGLNKLIGILDFETIQKDQIKNGTEQINQVAEIAGSLGELYRIGLGGFLYGISK